MEQSFRWVLSWYTVSKEWKYLLLDNILSNGVQRLRFSVENKIFTLMKEDRNFCIGRYNLENFRASPCPHQKEIFWNNGPVCTDCSNFNDFNPAFYNTSNISEKQKKYNWEPHVVYLANFAGWVNKVGIAHSKRALVRLLEQWARSAYIIKCHPNADEARSRESTISKWLQIKDTLQRSTKKKLIQTEYDSNKGKEELLAIIDRVRTIFPDSSIDEEFHYFDPFYLEWGDPLILKKYIHDISGKFISWKFIWLIWDILILEQADQQFMLSLKDFIWKLVEVSNVQKDYDTTIQSSLF
jgi:hypothetical protein